MAGGAFQALVLVLPLGVVLDPGHQLGLGLLGGHRRDPLERGEALADRCQAWLDGARARLDQVRGEAAPDAD